MSAASGIQAWGSGKKNSALPGDIFETGGAPRIFTRSRLTGPYRME